MDEAHKSKYSVHPGETKMFRDLKKEVLVEEHEERDCYLCF